MTKHTCCTYCDQEVAEVFYSFEDFRLYGEDPPDSVLHPVCADCYARLTREQNAKYAPQRLN